MFGRRKTRFSEVRQARWAVASAYALTYGDAATFAAVHAVEMENAALLGAVTAKLRQGHVRGGRHVFGRALAAIILALGLAFGARVILSAAPRIILMAAMQSALYEVAEAPSPSRTTP
ncbi:MAG: hypothetical protein ABJE47_25720 [bacterium]